MCDKKKKNHTMQKTGKNARRVYGLVLTQGIIDYLTDQEENVPYFKGSPKIFEECKKKYSKTCSEMKTIASPSPSKEALKI